MVIVDAHHPAIPARIKEDLFPRNGEIDDGIQLSTYQIHHPAIPALKEDLFL